MARFIIKKLKMISAGFLLALYSFQTISLSSLS